MKRMLPILFVFSLGLLFASTPTPTLSHGPGTNGSCPENSGISPRVAPCSGLFNPLPLMAPGRVQSAGRMEEPHHVYLPVVALGSPAELFDMLPFLLGDWRLYEVQHSQGSQARHQTQIAGSLFFHTKGHEIKAEWEELWATDAYIYRGTDTSPGHERYYTLRDPGLYGSVWAPRYWRPGESFYRNPLVTFYGKQDCAVVLTGTQASWLRFDAYYPAYTFDSGITLSNVIQLAWHLVDNDGGLGELIERYFYGDDYGLIGWWSNDRGMSYISEIHDPGQRPDNNREVIACLDRTPASPLQRLAAGKLPYWPGDHRR
jgi:hypothetical protein